jgi:membrane protease YdiL (CAAX protease family)
MTRPTRPRTPSLYHGVIDRAIGGDEANDPEDAPADPALPAAGGPSVDVAPRAIDAPSLAARSSSTASPRAIDAPSLAARSSSTASPRAIDAPSLAPRSSSTASPRAMAAIDSTSATWSLLLAVIAFYATALLTRPGLSQLVMAQCALGAGAVLAAVAATTLTYRERGSSLRAHRALGLFAPRPAAIAGALLVGATTWYPNLCLALWVQEQLGGATRVPGLERLTSGPDFALTVACISLFPAICEELAFRGLWARALAARFRIPLAVAITAPLFGLFHLSSAQLLPASLLGAVLAWSSLRGGSLWISMVIHAINNATALLASRGQLGPIGDAIDTSPRLAIAVALAIAAGGLTLIAAPRPASPDGRPADRS